MARTLMLILGLLLLVTNGCGRERGAQEAAQSTPDLISQVRGELQKSNPRITRVHFIKIIAGPTEDGRRYAALATGLADPVARLEDELFGVFVVDSSLTTIERVVQVLPSQRMLDYAVEISFPAMDTLLVRGFGIADNEGRVETRHVWVP